MYGYMYNSQHSLVSGYSRKPRRCMDRLCGHWNGYCKAFLVTCVLLLMAWGVAVPIYFSCTTTATPFRIWKLKVWFKNITVLFAFIIHVHVEFFLKDAFLSSHCIIIALYFCHISVYSWWRPALMEWAHRASDQCSRVSRLGSQHQTHSIHSPNTSHRYHLFPIQNIIWFSFTWILVAIILLIFVFCSIYNVFAVPNVLNCSLVIVNRQYISALNERTSEKYNRLKTSVEALVGIAHQRE